MLLTGTLSIQEFEENLEKTKIKYVHVDSKIETTCTFYKNTKNIDEW